MRSIRCIMVAALVLATTPAAASLKVICTSSSYKPIVEYLAGDLAQVSYIIKGYQDPHIVRPKPSLALDLAEADLLIATGLDLEAWLPALQDMSGNKKIMSGQKGYVSVSEGVAIMDKPSSLDRSEGDVHVFGNPHVHTSPIVGKVVAENIAIGLKRVDPEHSARYDERLAAFKAEIDRRLFGEDLVTLLGGPTLTSMALKGQLVPFLQRKNYKGKPLLDRLGGWLGQAMPLRGKKLVTYHKNWTYLVDLLGIQVVDYMEPKPGIPPSPGHVVSLIDKMQREHVEVVLAANYFDIGKVKRVTEKTGARMVVVALAVDGQDNMRTFFDQFDIWIAELNKAFGEARGS